MRVAGLLLACAALALCLLSASAKLPRASASAGESVVSRFGAALCFAAIAACAAPSTCAVLA